LNGGKGVIIGPSVTGRDVVHLCVGNTIVRA
jgi:hypothetical protein